MRRNRQQRGADATRGTAKSGRGATAQTGLTRRRKQVGAANLPRPCPISTDADRLIAQLRARRNARNIAGQRRFGITPQTELLGIPTPCLRRIARAHRRDQALAQELWASGIHDARLLATFIADPAKMTRRDMNRWTRDLDSWAVTDAAAFLFDRTPFAVEKAHAWSRCRREFEKRVAFSLMAGLAVHRKELPDSVFLGFLRLIRREATDERNFVRKAVNWALRQIGKRNPRLRRAAIAEARRIQRFDSRAARWIARDALRELLTRRPANTAAAPTNRSIAKRHPVTIRRPTRHGAGRSSFAKTGRIPSAARHSATAS